MTCRPLAVFALVLSVVFALAFIPAALDAMSAVQSATHRSIE